MANVVLKKQICININIVIRIRCGHTSCTRSIGDPQEHIRKRAQYPLSERKRHRY